MTANLLKLTTFILLLLCVGVVGCKRQYSARAAATVKLDGDAAAHSQFISYAQSSAFTAEVKSRLTNTVGTDIKLTVRPIQNTKLFELKAMSDDSSVVVEAAAVMVALLNEYVARENLGSVYVLDSPAVQPRLKE